jgi:hypothetical protein
MSGGDTQVFYQHSDTPTRRGGKTASLSPQKTPSYAHHPKPKAIETSPVFDELDDPHNDGVNSESGSAKAGVVRSLFGNVEVEVEEVSSRAKVAAAAAELAAERERARRLILTGVEDANDSRLEQERPRADSRFVVKLRDSEAAALDVLRHVAEEVEASSQRVASGLDAGSLAEDRIIIEENRSRRIARGESRLEELETRRRQSVESEPARILRSFRNDNSAEIEELLDELEEGELEESVQFLCKINKFEEGEEDVMSSISAEFEEGVLEDMGELAELEELNDEFDEDVEALVKELEHEEVELQELEADELAELLERLEEGEFKSRFDLPRGVP